LLAILRLPETSEARLSKQATAGEPARLAQAG